MKVLRTPESLFAEVPEFPFAPQFVDVRAGNDEESVRLAYVDEGPRQAPIVLMLHGEPTWSFLYRKVIAEVTRAGLRAVAPDLIGFGRSDKPVERADYTYARHVAWVSAFLDALDLRDVTLVCQDWGGLIGLRLVAERSERFARVLAANTSLPTGDGKMPDEFARWQRASQDEPNFSAGRIVARYSAKPLREDTMRAYDAPFPDESFKAAARTLPMLVPTTPDDPASEANRQAWGRLQQFQRPFLTVFGDADPFSAGADRVLQRKIPGAAGQPHRVLAGVGHFIQEDAGEELGRIAAAFART
jgi:haloalkane dehalogenase